MGGFVLIAQKLKNTWYGKYEMMSHTARNKTAIFQKQCS